MTKNLRILELKERLIKWIEISNRRLLNSRFVPPKIQMGSDEAMQPRIYYKEFLVKFGANATRFRERGINGVAVAWLKSLSALSNRENTKQVKFTFLFHIK